MNNIISYAHIKQNKVFVNEKLVFQSLVTATLSEFLSEAYKSLEISYPKFHKMDLQCKLGLLCTEFALKETSFLTENDLSKMAIVLANTASSLDTDRQYHRSIEDKTNYFPSPGVFVYTLPNIVIGELAIKHKITGENAFFVLDNFDVNLLINYIESLLNNGSQSVICGWVEVDGANYESFIFLTETSKNINKSAIFKPLNQLTVLELYNKTIWTH